MTSCDGVRVSVHRRGRRRAAAIASLCLLVGGFLAGCSTNDGVGSFIIDPGHYSVYHCDGLAARLKVLLAREQELTNLMDRASEGGGGVLIGNLTYRADYENTVGEEKVLRRTAAEKKCDLPPPAAPASPTPAAYTAPPPGICAATGAGQRPRLSKRSDHPLKRGIRASGRRTFICPPTTTAMIAARDGEQHQDGRADGGCPPAGEKCGVECL